MGMDPGIVAHGVDFALGFNEGDDPATTSTPVGGPVEGLACGFRYKDPTRRRELRTDVPKLDDAG